MNVTIFTKNKDNLSKNGAFSQVIFVYYCLNQIKNINCKVFTNNGIPIYKDVATYNNLEEFFEQDIIICLNALLLDEKIVKQIKKKKIKLIFYNCGNFYYVFQEDILFNHHNFIKKHNLYALKYYDKLIHIPNYTQYQDYYRSIFNIQNINIAPYIWYNNLIDDYMKKNKYSLFYDSKFNKSETKYILICEPNLQLTKTCLVPLLICNELYKSNFVNIKVLCLCKPKHLENLLKLTQHLEIFKNNLVEFYDRIEYCSLIKDLKTKDLDFCLLSNQKDNPLNFIHLETLYLKYGLIHNTPNYHKAGYYYKTIPEAVNQLKYCFENHSKNLKQYNYETRKVLDKFSPYNKNNQSIYSNYMNII